MAKRCACGAFAATDVKIRIGGATTGRLLRQRKLLCLYAEQTD
jgi:hypothetical protein